MRQSLHSAMLAFAAAVILAGSAVAQPRLQPPPQQPSQQPSQPQQPSGGGGDNLAATNPEITAAVAQAAGYQNVEVFQHENQRHVKAQVHGNTVLFIHNGCENNACRSLTMAVFFSQQAGIDLNWVNAWNSQMRFTKLALLQNGNLMFTYDIHFFGGLPATNFKESAVGFAGFLKQLLEFQPKK